MASRKLNWTSAHVRDRCDIAFHPDGQHLFTCGSDNMVRIFEARGEKQEAVRELEHHKDPVTCISIAASGDKFATGSKDHFAALWTYPPGSFDANATRFQLEINHVAFNPSGSYLAVASGESNIRYVTLAKTEFFSVMKGHEGAVLSLAFDPHGDYLASSGVDGTVRVWALADCSLVKTLPLLKKNPSPVPGQMHRIAWSPDGSYLAVTGAPEVRFFNRDTWEPVFSLKNGHTEDVSIVTFSPNGLYAASVGTDMAVVIWELKSNQSIDKLRHDSAVLGACWDPQGNGLAMIDENGCKTLWDAVIPAHLPHPAQHAEQVAKPTGTLFSKEDVFGEDVDEAERESTMRVGKKLRKKKITDDDDAPAPMQMQTRRTSPAREERKRDRDDKRDADTRRPRDQDEADDDMDEFIVNDSGPTAAQVLAEVSAQQDCFQPAATPEDETRRFLAYNLVGMIVTRDETTHSSVEIEFSDKTRHGAVRITDRYNFKVAALSEKGAIFASYISETAPSTIFYRAFTPWAPDNEWFHQFAAGEEANVVAVGRSWCAVATDWNFVRVFSHTGVQRFIFSLPGDIVTMVGYEGTALLVYHAGQTFKGNQAMHYMLMDMEQQVKLGEGPLPLCPMSKLAWAGFSDHGIPTTLDTNGIMRSLVREWDNLWTPLVNLKEAWPKKNDQVWVVGLTEDAVMAVTCKGRAFPLTLPRPTITAIPIHMPVLTVNNNMATLEDEYMRRAFALNRMKFEARENGTELETAKDIQQRETKLDQLGIRMIQFAVKGNKPTRALDISTRLYYKQSMQIALAIAQKENQTALAERLVLILGTNFKTGNRREAVGGVAKANERAAARRLEAETYQSFGIEERPGAGPLNALSMPDDVSDEEKEKKDADEGEAEFTPAASLFTKSAASKTKTSPASTEKKPPKQLPKSKGGAPKKADKADDKKKNKAPAKDAKKKKEKEKEASPELESSDAGESDAEDAPAEAKKKNPFATKQPPQPKREASTIFTEISQAHSSAAADKAETKAKRGKKRKSEGEDAANDKENVDADEEKKKGKKGKKAEKAEKAAESLAGQRTMTTLFGPPAKVAKRSAGDSPNKTVGEDATEDDAEAAAEEDQDAGDGQDQTTVAAEREIESQGTALTRPYPGTTAAKAEKALPVPMEEDEHSDGEAPTQGYLPQKVAGSATPTDKLAAFEFKKPAPVAS